MSQQPWGTPPSRQASWPAPQRPPYPTAYQTQPLQTGPFGYSPTGYPPPRQQPPRRRNPFAGALRVVVWVVAILFVASLLKDLLATRESAGPAPSAPIPTEPGSSTYVNEDYAPPPVDLSPPEIPVPRTVRDAYAFIEENPLYDQSIPVPTNCQMAAVDPSRATRAQLESHFNELMACLMAVWEEPVEAAGFQMPRPPVQVYDRPIRTACGAFEDVNAAYCSGDQRIYYAQPLLESFPASVANATYAAEMILAHEFGHAIQARTGILVSERALEQRESTNDALVLSRRTETQADCFSAQYVRSVAQSQQLGLADLQGLSALAYNLGDDVLTGQVNANEGHGLGRSRQAWFDRGLSSDAVGVCNTFIAAPSEVR